MKLFKRKAGPIEGLTYMFKIELSHTQDSFYLTECVGDTVDTEWLINWGGGYFWNP